MRCSAPPTVFRKGPLPFGPLPTLLRHPTHRSFWHRHSPPPAACATTCERRWPPSWASASTQTGQTRRAPAPTSSTAASGCCSTPSAPSFTTATASGAHRWAGAGRRWRLLLHAKSGGGVIRQAVSDGRRCPRCCPLHTHRPSLRSDNGWPRAPALFPPLQDILFYQLPEHPQFYSELLNLMEEGGTGESPTGGWAQGRGALPLGAATACAGRGQAMRTTPAPRSCSSTSACMSGRPGCVIASTPHPPSPLPPRSDGGVLTLRCAAAGAGGGRRARRQDAEAAQDGHLPVLLRAEI